MGSGASSQKAKSRRSSTLSQVSNGAAVQARKNSFFPNADDAPPPLPPSKRKEDIFQEGNFNHVDSHVMNLPPDVNYGTFKDLVTTLTDIRGYTDVHKVRSIFRWATSVDVFTIKTEVKPQPQSPMEYLIKIQNNQGNHAHLFAGLCQMAGIPCVIISGMNKSAAYEIGRSANRDAMSAQWNAVYVAGGWRFVDAFWASACVVGKRSGEWTLVDSDGELIDGNEDDGEATEGETQHRINEFYFFPEPEFLIWTHLPDDAKWQLLATPISVKEFEDHYYVRERFHILGMTNIPKTVMQCKAETKEGEAEFTFGLPPSRSGKYRYKYMLYRQRNVSSDSKIDSFLDRFVFFEQRFDVLRFGLRFPIKGSFKLDIYGLDIADGDVFDLCCTYIIDCISPKQNCLPLPDCPDIGWGPNAETEAAGLTPITHTEAVVTTKDGYVEIKLEKDRALAFHQMLKHAVIDDATLSRYAVTELGDKTASIYLRLPQKGEYALKLFAQDLQENGGAPNVLNYLIDCMNTDVGTKPFPNITNGLLGCNQYNSKAFGVKALSHPGGMINTTNGKLSIDMQASENVELVCEIHTNDGVALQQVKKVVKNEGGKWTFDLDLPVKGEYSLNVFAKPRGETTDQIYNVHTYLINSDGCGNENNSDGEEQETQIPTETVETSDGEVIIPVPPGCVNAVAAVHMRNGNEPPDPNQVEFFSAEDMNLVKVKLNDYGEYMLNLYSCDKDGNQVENVAKYQINRKRPGELYANNLNTIMEDMKPSRQQTTVTVSDKAERTEEEKIKAARRKVQNALDLKDPRQLEQAIKQFLDSGVDENDPLLKKAQQQLEILRAKAALQEASQMRDMALLEKALVHAKSVNVNHELDLQIAMASRLKDHLQKIDKLRHAVLNMESKTISEIKSYSKPPDGVHQCLLSTFLLLGHSMKELKEWQRIQALLGKTGRESVMRKISSFNAQEVPMKQAQTAKATIQPFTIKQIRDVSAGAATFYVWCEGMIAEVESYGGAEKADKLRLEK